MADQTWVARTRRLDRDLDLFDVAGDDGVLFHHEGHGLAGRGVLRRVDVPMDDPGRAAANWRQVVDEFVIDDEVGLPGCGPVALAALPFDPAATGSLVVPELVVGRAEDGTRWVTRLSSAEDDTDVDAELTVGALLGGQDGSLDDPGALEIRSTRTPQDWMDALVAGRDQIRGDGPLRKFVLAREIVVRSDRPLSRRSVLGRLRAAYPACFITAIDQMVGASPELLLSRRGDIVRSRPLAGTAPRSPDPAMDARLAATLLASSKNRQEHQIVIDMVHDTLLPWCSYLDAEPEPSVIGMANVQHLATYLEGRLSTPAASAIELVTALHPTPAICGTPTDVALDVIRRIEGFDRGAYAGPVGWVDAQGNGDWAVGIRSAELDGTTARVFAGVGVVADSDPVAELEETRNKLQAMLSALLRP